MPHRRVRTTGMKRARRSGGSVSIYSEASLEPIDRKVKPQLRPRRGEYGPRLLAPVAAESTQRCGGMYSRWICPE